MDTAEARAIAKSLGLMARSTYWTAKLSALEEMTGGCGPGRLGDALIPDTVWFLSIRPACSIHDYDYALGTGHGDKVIADWRFLRNMMRLIRSQSRWKWLAALRERRAFSYFQAVWYGGQGAFEK